MNPTVRQATQRFPSRGAQNGPASCMTQAVIEVIEVTLLAEMIYGYIWLTLF